MKFNLKANLVPIVAIMLAICSFFLFGCPAVVEKPVFFDSFSINKLAEHLQTFSYDFNTAGLYAAVVFNSFSIIISMFLLVFGVFMILKNQNLINPKINEKANLNLILQIFISIQTLFAFIVIICLGVSTSANNDIIGICTYSVGAGTVFLFLFALLACLNAWFDDFVYESIYMPIKKKNEKTQTKIAQKLEEKAKINAEKALNPIEVEEISDIEDAGIMPDIDNIETVETAEDINEEISAADIVKETSETIHNAQEKEILTE